MASSQPPDKNMGEIYLLTNTINNMKYIGQAPKYLKSGQRWAGNSRWKRHIWDSIFKGGVNTMIAQAIREYGPEAFGLMILCSCHLDKMDEYEDRFIVEYDTLAPNGYNMKRGGKHGALTEVAKDKMRGARGELSDESRKNMSAGQIGKRYEEKERKREEDKDLPKYIGAIRNDDVVIGYQVKKFPMGIDSKVYIYKTFKAKKDLPGALAKAKEYLDGLYKEYDSQKKALVEFQKELDVIKASGVNTSRNPEHVYHLIVDGSHVGFFVYGLKDYKGQLIPRREFKDNTKACCMDNAMKFIEAVKDLNDKKTIPEDWTKLKPPRRAIDKELPRHISKSFYKGVHTGYRVEYLCGKDKDGKRIFKNKTFAKRTLTLEEKLELAKQHVIEMEEKYANTSDTITGS